MYPRARFLRESDLRLTLDSSALLAIVGWACLAAAAFALLARYSFVDQVTMLAGKVLSPDGIITEAGVARMARALAGLALVASAGGLFCLLASNPTRRAGLMDALQRDRLSENAPPTSPRLTLFVSLAFGGAIFVLWMLRTSFETRWLFAKEAALENASFVLLMISSVLCTIAARRRNVDGPVGRRIALMYFLAAVGLFLVAMEEISWGQVWFGFSTPADWASLNYQHETTLHNLLAKELLTRGTQFGSLGFAAAVIASWFVVAKTRSPFLLAVLPHPALVPLAVLVAFAGVWVHPEIAEFLIAVFALLYSYRVWRPAGMRSSR
ncbi:MAG: hypothetical protein ACT4O5_14125 [Gammaproteobacteria bacterium]